MEVIPINLRVICLNATKILPEITRRMTFRSSMIVTQFKKMLRAKINRTAYVLTTTTTTNSTVLL